VRAALAGGCRRWIAAVCLVAERGAEAGDVLQDIAYRQIGDSEITSFLGGGQKNVPFAPAAMLHEALCRGPGTFDLARSGAGEKKRGPLVTSLVLAALLAMMLIPYVVVPLEIVEAQITAIEEQIRFPQKGCDGCGTAEEGGGSLAGRAGWNRRVQEEKARVARCPQGVDFAPPEDGVAHKNEGYGRYGGDRGLRRFGDGRALGPGAVRPLQEG